MNTVLIEKKQIQILFTPFSRIYFNINLSTTYNSCRFPIKILCFLCFLSDVYAPHSYHPLSFDHPNTLCFITQDMKLLITRSIQFPPASVYLPSCICKYSPQHPVKDPQRILDEIQTTNFLCVFILTYFVKVNIVCFRLLLPKRSSCYTKKK